MNPYVSLAGHLMRWSFRGSDPLDAWLREYPWLERGGVAILRIEEKSDFIRLSTLLETQIRGIDAGRSNLEIWRIDNVIEVPLRKQIAYFLGISTDTTHTQLLQQLAISLRTSPLFLISPPSQTSAHKLIQQAERLFEELGKMDPPGPLCLVHFDAIGDLHSHYTTYDFTTGLPEAQNLSSILHSQMELWAAYIHHRLAWESGGSMNISDKWSIEHLDLGLACGDDGSFEKALNQQALCLWDSKEDEVRADLVRTLLNLMNGTPISPTQERQLTGLGMLWRPLGGTRHQVTPWVARALLIEQSVPKARQLLRGALICAPISRFILQRCFDLEIWTRAQAQQSSSSTYSSEETKNYLQGFRTGSPQSAARFYPTHCPAVPNTELAFASLGNLYGMSNLPIRQKKALRQLTTLRNAIAHGHYVSWRSLTTLLEISRALG